MHVEESKLVPEAVGETKTISVKRERGLGNIFCLLPVLDEFYRKNHRIKVTTRPEWVGAFSAIRPRFLWHSQLLPGTIDLDALTATLSPAEHRSDEFSRLLGLSGPVLATRVTVAEAWSRPFEHLRGSVVLAPEGGHPSRSWPVAQAAQLHEHIRKKKLVVIGTETEPSLPCDVDLRGQLTLSNLCGLLSVAGTVITMDSGVLHISAAVGTATVAIFGGIDPAYRIRPGQRVVAIQAEIECCPCNKNEICDGQYPCIKAAQPQDVLEAAEIARRIPRRVICRVVPAAELLDATSSQRRLRRLKQSLVLRVFRHDRR